MMTARLRTTAVMLPYLGSLLPAWLRHERATVRPQQAQEQRLRALLALAAGSAFGQEHDLHGVDSVEAYQRRVPVRRYRDLEPWIERVVRGERAVLNRCDVLAVETSSGSTGARKWVPYTRELLREFACAANAWLASLHVRHPGLVGGRAYWSISPVTRRAQVTEGGVPIGLPDDAAYFGPLRGWAVRQMSCVPSRLAQLPDIEAWRWETAMHLLRAADLRLVSVWSPTFLSDLMTFIEENLPRLRAELPASRRRAIDVALTRRDSPLGRAMWPELRLISCWRDGPSAAFARALSRWFSGVPIQGKGLLATEGVVSIPAADEREGAVAAVTAHFLEFIDRDRPARRPLLAHELDVGGYYEPVLTTGGGLYRYALGDVVQCVGYLRATPRLRFVGKGERVSDLVGEKLNEAHVSDAIAAAVRAAGEQDLFAMLFAWPGEQERRYGLLLDRALAPEALQRLTRALEEALHENPHYAYARKLGQLRPLRVVTAHEPAVRVREFLRERGQRLGDIKPPALDVAGMVPALFDEELARGVTDDVVA